MVCRPTLQEQTALGVIAMAGMGLSCNEFERNFDLDAEQVDRVLHGLVEKGLAEHIGGGYFQMTERGRMRVEIRGGARVTA